MEQGLEEEEEVDPRIQVRRRRGAPGLTRPRLPRKSASTRTHALQPRVSSIAGWRPFRFRTCTEAWDTPISLSLRGRLPCPRGRGLIIWGIPVDLWPNPRVPATQSAVQADCNKGKRGRGPRAESGYLGAALDTLNAAQPPGFGAALPRLRGRGHHGVRAGPGGCRLPLRRELHRCRVPRSPHLAEMPCRTRPPFLVHCQHTHRGLRCLGLKLSKTLLFLEVGCEH